MRKKILDLFEEVKKVEKSSSVAANKSYRAANEVSGGLISSYSAAGDAEHSRNSANLSIQKAETIKKLKEELERSLNSESPENVKPVCFISLKFEGGNQKDLYLVENPVFITGFNLISASSPLGESLLGKRMGEQFSYTSGEQKYKGNVLEIE
jgi:hypothetical protein